MLDWNNIRFFLSMTHCIAQIVFSQMNYISIDNFIRFFFLLILKVFLYFLWRNKEIKILFKRMKKAYLFCIYHNSFEDCLKRTRMSKTCSCHLKASRKTISGIAHSSESMRSGWWGRSKNVSPELMNPKRWKKCCTTLGQGMSCTALRWITWTWVQYDLFKNIFFFISSFLLITSYLPCNNMTQQQSYLHLIWQSWSD